MRKISANLIFDGEQFLRNTVLVVGKKGEILDLQKINQKETPGIEYYEGLIVPGFINMHQHLELAWMYGKIEKTKTLSQFIKQLLLQKQTSLDEKQRQDAIFSLDTNMYKQGLSCVVDIANTADSIEVKQKSKIKYFTMLELYSRMGDSDELVYEYGEKLKKEFDFSKLETHITPHAFYSTSNTLLNFIAENNKSFLSIHFLESPDELDLLKHKDSDLKALSYKNKIKTKPDFKFAEILEFIKRNANDKKMLLVHNTLLSQEIIDEFSENELKNTLFCLCPNSNLHISDKLPNFNMFENNKLNYCFGTDSLASNSQISFLSELKIVQDNMLNFKMANVLNACTLTPASFLGINDEFGCFKQGTKPGIVLINDVDTINYRFTEKSSSKRLL
ncbi:MAG: amidohydrolase family protein [Bacteroidales bacterium]|nr:amidohydrolase family protein [Bacteroidales bacterium]